MKRLAIALTALSLLTPAAAMAQNGYQHVGTKIVIKEKSGTAHRQHHWARGRVLPHRYRGDVVVYNRYHLRRPGRNRVWVRAEGQFLLIDKNTGAIIATATPR